MNLLRETLDILSQHGKRLDDVVAICNNSFQITKQDFIEYADMEYDNGYGCEEINPNLKLIGEDFWLERNTYDGSEWWEYKTFPQYSNLPYKKADEYTLRVQWD